MKFGGVPCQPPGLGLPLAKIITGEACSEPSATVFSLIVTPVGQRDILQVDGRHEAQALRRELGQDAADEVILVRAGLIAGPIRPWYQTAG